jgi:type II secretory pathway pseudopilin PulG
MKIPPKNRRGSAGFTMIEIAMAVGVIAFALIAIMGILPYGLNVQKDNREDTIISQDAPFFLEAIRNGAGVPPAPGALPPPNQSLDFLTNYIESITITNITLGGSTNYTVSTAVTNQLYLTNGFAILGLLSMPEIYPYGQWLGRTNRISARVRSLSGSAAEVGVSNSQMAFSYAMAVEIAPFNSFAMDTTNYAAYTLNTPDQITRSNRWATAQHLPMNLFEVRLTFSWPILPNGNIGPNRQTYRTTVSSPLLPSGGGPLWFFKPQTFTNGPAT